MRSHLLCLLAVFLPTAGLAQDGIRIDEVGLHDYYSSAVPTPVRIHISTPARAQSIQLEFKISSGSTNPQSGLWRVDQFSKQAEVRPGESIDVEVPLFVAWAEQLVLDVAATDATGQKIGQTTQNLKSLVHIGGTESLIAVYCKHEKYCQDAQSQITFSGTDEERSKKNKEFKFVTLQKPRQHWWAYGAAHALVLAGPISDLTSEGRKALEYYLRGGGTLVLLEEETADGNFLAAYRTRAPGADPVVVGRGRLYCLPSLQSGRLGKVFTGNVLKQFAYTVRSFPVESGVDAILSRVGVSFSFPRLPWLMIWLAVYILIVGLANFTLLRRLRKLEWGWATIFVVALLFAAGIYVSSSTRRPKNFTLDDLAVYWMDGHSSVALGDFGLRVSSPQRRQIAVSVSDNVVLDAPERFRAQGSSSVNIASEITDKRRIEAGWQVQLGPPLEIKLRMLRWSLKDLELEGFREFSGSVHWTSATRLKNDTGQRFREGIYLDFKANKKYVISSMAPGEEIDLTGMPAEVIWIKDKEESRREQLENVRFARQPKNGPFSVAELPYSGFQFGPARRVFVGLSDERALGAKLQGVEFNQRSFALTVVSLDEP